MSAGDILRAPLVFTVFRDVHAKVLAHKRMPPIEIAERIRQISAPQKSGCRC
jgi:hypothetical protein